MHNEDFHSRFRQNTGFLAELLEFHKERMPRDRLLCFLCDAYQLKLQEVNECKETAMRQLDIKIADKGEGGDITRRVGQLLELCADCEEEKLIRFEKGEYHFYEELASRHTIYASNTDSDRFPEKTVFINIHKIKRLTIDGSGSKFIFHGKGIPFCVRESEDITLKNFTWDFPVAGTLECQVIKRGLFYTDFSFYKSCQWEISGRRLIWFEESPLTGKRYWQSIGQQSSHCIVIKDDEGLSARFSLKHGPFFAVRKIKRLSDRSVRVYYLKRASSEHKQSRVLEVCPNYNRDCVGSFFCQSKNLQVENVCVGYMHGFGWLSQLCENVSFKNCRFIPFEESDRKSTGFADLLHFSGIKGRVHIENCQFSDAHDDPINIHGTYTEVRRIIDSHTLELCYKHHQQRGFRQYFEGDTVAFYRKSDFTAAGGEYRVKSVIHPLEKGNSADNMIVEFTCELPAELREGDYVCNNISYSPQVYVGGCSFSKIPTRGLLCTASGRTVIENNRFENMTMAAIYISDDCSSWYESGKVRDMVIRNNVFIVGKSFYKGKRPAVLIEPMVCRAVKEPFYVHSNITLEGNRFELESDIALDARYCRGLYIRDNYISGADSQTAFRLEQCSEVDISGNHFE